MAINNAGQVALDDAVWKEGAPLRPIAAPPGITVDLADINERGEAVGRAIVGGSGRAFFWQPGTGMVLLPDLNASEQVSLESSAHALNDRGQVVGRSSGHAVLWNVRATDAGAPVVSRLLAAPLPEGVYADYAPEGGVWLRVRLTDADTPAPGPWTWRIDWGDGVVHTPTVAIKGEFVFLRPTRYAQPGPHAITVTATDPLGATSPITTTTAP